MVYLALEYVFVIVCTLQGFALFFACCFFDDELRGNLLWIFRKVERPSATSVTESDAILLDDVEDKSVRHVEDKPARRGMVPSLVADYEEQHIVKT